MSIMSEKGVLEEGQKAADASQAYKQDILEVSAEEAFTNVTN
jgi:hypothetical protein